MPYILSILLRHLEKAYYALLAGGIYTSRTYAGISATDLPILERGMVYNLSKEEQGAIPNPGRHTTADKTAYPP